MSKSKRGPRLTTNGRPVDRIVHPKTGRRKGEKMRDWMDNYTPQKKRGR